MGHEICIGCKAKVKKEVGFAHPYIGASKGCWTMYGQVLNKEYGEYGYPDITHRLTVDTYAVQHPGQISKRSIQSVNLHLLGLYMILKMDSSGSEATKTMGLILSKKPSFVWLTPPEFEGSLTIAHVLEAENLKAHKVKVREWAENVFKLWYDQHRDTIKSLAQSMI